MKAKIYPLNPGKSLKVIVPPSHKFLHFEIICAALAKGTSVIKNINYNQNVLDTINWCRQIGATIQQEAKKLIIHGINNQLEIKNNVFSTSNSFYTLIYMLPLLSLTNQPIILKTPSDMIIEKTTPYKHIFEKENLYFAVENHTIKIEQAIKSGFIYINGHGNTSLIAGLLLALPLLSTGSKVVIRYPITNREDIYVYVNIIKKFGIHIVIDPSKHTLEVLPNQTFSACSIKTESDFYLASMFSILKIYAGNIQLKNLSRKSIGTDFLLVASLKNMNIDLFHLSSMNNKKIKKIDLPSISTKQYLNAIPLFVGIAMANSLKLKITDFDVNNTYQQTQIKVLTDILKILEVEYNLTDNEMVIDALLPQVKKQIDCQNEPYLAIVFSLLAVVSKAPLIIKNCQCVDLVWSGFYDIIKGLGSIVEFIHD